MFKQRQDIVEILIEVVDKFRKKDATSPDKAVTAEELGLPWQFKEAMNRRLGQLGIFVEVNCKYYLAEERLKEVQEKFATRQKKWW